MIGVRKHRQSTYGPENLESHVCGTPMCTAGHLINLAGKAGWDQKELLGWVGAATLIHNVNHPDHPPQNYGHIPDGLALAYIQAMAEIEAGRDPKVTMSGKSAAAATNAGGE